MPISGICKRDYLYGDGLEIEQWFSGLETKWAPVLKKIIRQGSLNLSPPEWTLLLEFIFLSEARTGYTADIADDFTTKVVQAIMMTKRKHGVDDYLSFTDDQIMKMKVGMNIPNAASIRSMDKALWLFSDLALMLIYNTTSRPFITSDNPVVKYNYLFATRNYRCNYGYGNVGILIFIPISPQHCLMTYDPATYRTSSSTDVLEIHAPNQIIELNKLFAINSKSAVYFQNSAREWVIEEYARGIHDTSKKYNNHILQNDAGEYLVQFSSPSIFERFKLDFLIINPQMLHMIFPNNMAGPIRPAIREMQRQDKLDSIPGRIMDSPFRYLPQFD